MRTIMHMTRFRYHPRWQHNTHILLNNYRALTTDQLSSCISVVFLYITKLCWGYYRKDGWVEESVNGGMTNGFDAI